MVPSGSGHLSTIVGTGEPAYAGDGGPAVSAGLNEPKAVVFDLIGNLYIADSENHVIRCVDRVTGMIRTVAGCVDEQESPMTVQDSSEASVPPSASEDPLADFADNPAAAYEHTPDLSGTVRYWGGKPPTETRFAGDEGAAVTAKLNFPSGIAVDEATHVYIADTLNHRIRRVDADTGVISTVAGTGRAKWTGDGGAAESASLNEPVALVIDRKGRLYIADQSNNRVRMLDTTTGVITTVAGTGEATYNGDDLPAAEGALAGPSGLALDDDGHLYIADTFNNRIRKVHRETGVMTTVVGNGHAFQFAPDAPDAEEPGASMVARPYGIAFDRNGRLLITDSDNHLLRTWDPVSNVVTRVAGTGASTFSGDGGVATSGSLNFPFGVAVDHEGHIAVADTFNHRVRGIVR